MSEHRVDAGSKDGPTSDDLTELRRLRAVNKRLREHVEMLRKASIFFAGNSTPQPLIMGFIDELRSQGTRSSRYMCRPPPGGLPGRRAHRPGLACPHQAVRP